MSPPVIYTYSYLREKPSSLYGSMERAPFIYLALEVFGEIPNTSFITWVMYNVY